MGCVDARPAPARDLAVPVSCPRPPGESFGVLPSPRRAGQRAAEAAGRAGPGRCGRSRAPAPGRAAARAGSAAPPPPPPPPRQSRGGSGSRTPQLSLKPHSQRGAWRPSACPSCPSLPAHPSWSSLHQQQGNTILRLRIWSRLNILFIFSD